MQNLTINTGVIRLTINDDPQRVISFNPTDISFAERFYDLMQDFEVKQGEYQARAEVLDQNTAVDDNGLPVNLSARIAFMRDICTYMHEQIDHLFGANTSQIVFEGALSLEGIEQFFTGITPFVQTARKDKMAKYQPPPPRKVRARK